MADSQRESEWSGGEVVVTAAEAKEAARKKIEAIRAIKDPIEQRIAYEKAYHPTETARSIRSRKALQSAKSWSKGQKSYQSFRETQFERQREQDRRFAEMQAERQGAEFTPQAEAELELRLRDRPQEFATYEDLPLASLEDPEVFRQRMEAELGTSLEGEEVPYAGMVEGVEPGPDAPSPDEAEVLGERTVVEFLLEKGATESQIGSILDNYDLKPGDTVTTFLKKYEAGVKPEKWADDFSRAGVKIAGLAKQIEDVDREFQTAQDNYERKKKLFDDALIPYEKDRVHEQLRLMRDKTIILNNQAEAAGSYAAKVKAIDDDLKNDEQEYEVGIKALWERGLKQVGIDPKTGEALKPGERLEEPMGWGPSGFTNADGSFSALRTAHTMFWILGALANTGLSTVSAIAGEKMGTIPNFLTNALFKAMEMDAQKESDRLALPGRLMSRGVNAWGALIGRARNSFERKAAIMGAISLQAENFLKAIDSNPDFQEAKKNPHFQNQIRQLGEAIGVYKAKQKSTWMKARRDAAYQSIGKRKEVWSAESAAARDSMNVKLNRMKSLDAIASKDSITEFKKHELDWWGEYNMKHEELMKGLALIDMIVEHEGLAPTDLLGLKNIILAETGFAKAFGGKQESDISQLVQVLHLIGEKTGRGIMREYESGQSTEKDAAFGRDQTWLSTQNVAYIKNILETRLNDIISLAVGRRHMLIEEHHPRVDGMLLRTGIGDAVRLLGDMQDPGNSLTVSKLDSYSDGHLRQRWKNHYQRNLLDVRQQ